MRDRTIIHLLICKRGRLKVVQWVMCQYGHVSDQEYASIWTRVRCRYIQCAMSLYGHVLVEIFFGIQGVNFHMDPIIFCRVYQVSMWTDVRGSIVRYSTYQTGALKISLYKESIGYVAVLNIGSREVDGLNWKRTVSLSAEWLIWCSSLWNIYHIIQLNKSMDVDIFSREASKCPPVSDILIRFSYVSSACIVGLFGGGAVKQPPGWGPKCL